MSVNKNKTNLHPVSSAQLVHHMQSRIEIRTNYVDMFCGTPE